MAASRKRQPENRRDPHRPYDGGVTHSPEAIRQMGAAIRAAAARSGARINPDDPALHQAIAGFIGADGMQRLATGDAAMIGLVDRFVEQHATTIAQHQKQHDARGLAQAEGAGPVTGESLTERLQRVGAFGRYADASTGERPPARYGELPGTSVPGNADMRGISMANYATSAMTRAMVDAGMTYGTFDYLRGQGFNQSNIANAGRDARALGFSANDKAAVRNHATIDKHDPKARETNDHLREFRKGLADNADFKKAVQDLDQAKTEEDRKKAQARVDKIIEEQANKHHVNKDILDKEKPAIVQEAIKEQKKAVAKQQMDEVRQLRHKMGLEQKSAMSNQERDATLSHTEQTRVTSEDRKTAANYENVAQGTLQTRLGAFGPATSPDIPGTSASATQPQAAKPSGTQPPTGNEPPKPAAAPPAKPAPPAVVPGR